MRTVYPEKNTDALVHVHTNVPITHTQRRRAHSQCTHSEIAIDSAGLFQRSSSSSSLLMYQSIRSIGASLLLLLLLLVQLDFEELRSMGYCLSRQRSASFKCERKESCVPRSVTHAHPQRRPLLMGSVTISDQVVSATWLHCGTSVNGFWAFFILGLFYFGSLLFWALIKADMQVPGLPIKAGPAWKYPPRVPPVWFRKQTHRRPRHYFSPDDDRGHRHYHHRRGRPA